MPVKKSTKIRRPKATAEVNGAAPKRPKWEIEMEKTIDEMFAPLDGDVVRRFDIRTAQHTSIPDLRNRLQAGRPGALLFSLYRAADHDGVRTGA